MKKYLISTFALAMIFSSSLNVHANNKIKDIDGHWAQKQITHFIQNSYAKGYEDNTFRPDNQITRAEFVKLVNTYFGFSRKGVSEFKDVNQGSWYYDDICIAINSGYINGYGDNTFRPDNIITREEAAKIIISIKNQEDNSYNKLNTFPDKNLVSDWAKPYVEGAIENGYLKGDDLKNLRPTSHITRAESVSLLSRVNSEDEYYIESLIEANSKYPRIDYNYVTYSVVQGNRWDYNTINATAFNEEHEELDVHYEGNVDTNTPGLYPVKIVATDETGKTNSKEVFVEVEDIHVVENRHLYPQVISKDLRLRKGAYFDYKMLEATSYDINEKDLTDTITYVGNVDTSKKGRYPVQISAKDSKGLVSTLLVLVTVY